MVVIDGSTGEGGGQILRTSLSLSLLTGKPFRMENIRARRAKPGVLRQHLASINAAVEVGNAEVSGNSIGSSLLEFAPKGINSGAYSCSIGSAGSCTLVLQTILPALLIADGTSEVSLEGGTHNPFAPPFDFLKLAFLPILSRMGPKVGVELASHGFYPAGGGRFTARIEPVKKLTAIDILERGDIVRRKARSLVARLPLNIGKRQLDVVKERLGWEEDELSTEDVGDSRGPGNVLIIEVESRDMTEVFTGFGERGVMAETIAGRTSDEVREYLAADVPVGEHLADQLLIPMAMAGRGSFRTTAPTRHTLTNIEILKKFIEVGIEARHLEGRACEMTIRT